MASILLSLVGILLCLLVKLLLQGTQREGEVICRPSGVMNNRVMATSTFWFLDPYIISIEDRTSYNGLRLKVYPAS